MAEDVVVEDEFVVLVLSVLSSSPPVGFCSVLEDSFDVLDSVVLDVVRELEFVVT